MASSKSTSLHLTWLLSILLNNKNALKQAQEELDLKVGKERWVDDQNIKDLVYLQAIVKETLHLYSPAPLSAPHEAMEDCHVCGYYVPKGTCVLLLCGSYIEIQGFGITQISSCQRGSSQNMQI